MLTLHSSGLCCRAVAVGGKDTLVVQHEDVDKRNRWNRPYMFWLQLNPRDTLFQRHQHPSIHREDPKHRRFFDLFYAWVADLSSSDIVFPVYFKRAGIILHLRSYTKINHRNQQSWLSILLVPSEIQKWKDSDHARSREESYPARHIKGLYNRYPSRELIWGQSN